MHIQDIWRVKTAHTKAFQSDLRKAGKTFVENKELALNASEYNYFCETPEQYIHITPEQAQQWADEQQMEISDYIVDEKDLRLQLLVARIERDILNQFVKANVCPTCALKAFAQVCTDMVQIFEQQQVISKEDAERLLAISKNKKNHE